MEQEKILDAVNSTLNMANDALKDYKKVYRHQNILILVAFLVIAVVVGFFTVTNCIRDAKIAQLYFNQTYSQSVKSDSTIIKQNINGGD